MTVREQVRLLRHETGASDVDLLVALEPAARCWTSPASKRGSSAC